MRRLFAAIVQGIGWSAGKDIYEEAKTKVRAERARQPRTEKAQEKAARAAEKARLAAEKERAAVVKQRAKALESELRALKQKVGR